MDGDGGKQEEVEGPPTPPEYVVRAWKAGDDGAVIHLYQLVHAKTILAAYKSVRKFVRRCVSKKDLGDIHRNYIEPHGCGFWVAETVEDAPRIVGCVGIQPLWEPDVTDGDVRGAELKRLAVDASMRRQGVGTALVAAALSFARDATQPDAAAGRLYNRVQAVTPRDFTAAAAVYEASGFVDEAAVPDAAADAQKLSYHQFVHALGGGDEDSAKGAGDASGRDQRHVMK